MQSLQECVKQGDLDGLKRLVERDGERALEEYRLMQIAAHHGHNAIIEYLHSIDLRIDNLSAGRIVGSGPVDEPAWREITPTRALVLAVDRGSRLLCNGDVGGVSTVKVLLEKGANPNPLPMEMGAPLYDTIDMTDNTTISRELLQYGANVDFNVENFRSHLVLAAQEGRVNQLQLLLEAGADPWLRGYVPGEMEEDDDDFGTVFDVATGRAKKMLEEWQRAYDLAKARRIRDAINKALPMSFQGRLDAACAELNELRAIPPENRNATRFIQLTAEIRTNRDKAAEERAAVRERAAEERADVRERAAEERAAARERTFDEGVAIREREIRLQGALLTEYVPEPSQAEDSSSQYQDLRREKR